MKIFVLANPISGRGGAESAADRLVRSLKQMGHDVWKRPTEASPDRGWIATDLDRADLMIIAGGDGAVRLAAPDASDSGVPIYHYPFGTENLFSREWSMDHNRERLRIAIDRWDIRKVDLGVANADNFVLMASVGFDAEVVHDLAQHREGSIRHLSYVKPIMRQFWRWEPPRLHVTVDGRKSVQGAPGFVVIANSRQYGWRFNPALEADMTDGLLDVVFFPCRSRWDLLGWAVATRLRRHRSRPTLIYERGKDVQIRGETPMNFQLDGDPPSMTEPVTEIGAFVRPGVLKVLAP